jgi:enoyl-[acyl-carrier-protein] reductase (NADH)
LRFACAERFTRETNALRDAWFDRLEVSASALHRHIAPYDCGAAAPYLLSDDAKNVTGTTLYVDACYHAMGM